MLLRNKTISTGKNKEGKIIPILDNSGKGKLLDNTAQEKSAPTSVCCRLIGKYVWTQGPQTATNYCRLNPLHSFWFKLRVMWQETTKNEHLEKWKD